MRTAVLLCVAACAPAFDDTRTESDPGTFGEHVATLMCKRLAFSADPTDVSGDTYRATCMGGALPDNPDPSIAALEADRARTIAAIDLAVPPDKTDALDAYLTSDAVLSLYDDGTMATSISNLGDMLDEFANDGDAMAALSRIGARDGYRRADVAIGQLGPMMSSVDLPALLDALLPAVDSGGVAKAQWDQVIAAASATLHAAAPQTDVPNSTATIVNQLLLTEHPELAEATPLPIVVRDASGNAVATGTPTAAPFVGNDKSDGYTYKDVTATLIGAMGTDTRKLLDPANSTALDLLQGAVQLLGARTSQTKTFDDGSTLAYTGFDVAHSPLLDLAYAFSQLLRDPLIDDTLALGDQLFSEAHRAATARIIEAAIATARLADAFPEANILANAPLWDDLRPLLQKITADPSLTKNLLVALQDPEVQKLNQRFAEQMTYSDRFDIDPTTQKLTGTFATKPDRTQPDSDFNRSVFQRLLMVINDSNGAKQCNKQNGQVKLAGIPLGTYAACALFEVDNLAVFYTQAIAYAKDANGAVICESNAGIYGATKTAATGAGCAANGAGWRPRPKANFNYNWGAVVSSGLSLQGGDAYLESQSTITGFRTHPTPEALNRVLFLDPTPQTIQDTADPMTDKDGDLFKVQHAGTLPVWEANDFYTEIRPIVQAFADANQEQTFVDILSVFHKHWSSMQSTNTQHTDPAGKNYSFGSNTQSYETYVSKVFTDGDIWPALTATSAELTAIVANGKSMPAIAAHAGNYLTSPLAGLTDRLGGTTSTTSDGKPVTALTPWQLLADAEDAKNAVGSQLWKDSARELVDIMFRGDATGGWHFTNAHTPTMTLAVTAMIRGRLAAHTDRAAWTGKELPDRIQDFLTHPLAAAASDLITALDGAPRKALEQLLFDLFDPDQPAYQVMRASTAEWIQLSLDDVDLVPMGHIVGQLLAKSYLPTQLALLRRLHAADGDKTLNDIVARLFQADSPGVSTISAIADGVGDVDRVSPGPTPPAWSAADYASTFHTVAAFFKEEQRGLLRFIAIVKGRNP